MNKFETEYRQFLISQGNNKYKDFNSQLIIGSSPIIGIPIPRLKEFSKELAKSKELDYLNINTMFYEEKTIKGLMIGYLKTDFNEVISFLKKFVFEIDNWATCDVTVGNLKIFKKHLDEGWDFINHCLNLNLTYSIRFAVVIMLSYYLKEEYLERVFSICKSIKHDDYYVKMAVSWLISMAYVKFPKETLQLFDGSLDKFTHNKAISKIQDSLRVSKEDKMYIKTLRV